ncbi:LysR family transcriptional regulator [Siculibacillus lacustris]|uniref:LysR family transcriptional regulator n=1 Tax=Siculibacillus lacustris TaxID=1549641 RepID=A0A4V2KTD9_9HYPH|nr:LysR family transcriptional regulator [Siculibacillus lacustris]TBW36789.1 LysR family transcriptional regulator [Siculibacillus lacustris]
MHSPPTLQTLCSRLRYRHLHLLDALGRSHNMHVAAQQLNITQPAATKILQDIEDLFDLELFERLPRDMKPTEIGEFVLRFAHESLNVAGKFIEELDQMKRGGYGVVQVGVTYGAAFLLSPCIMRMKERHPRVSIRVLERTSDLLLEELKEKTLDLVIGRYTGEDQHNWFDFRDLGATRMCVVANPHHPLLKETALTLHRLMDWPWIVQPLTTPTRRLFEGTLADHGLTCPVNIVETTSIFTTLQLLQASDMLTVLPSSAVDAFVAQKLLAKLPLDFARQIEDYGVLTRRGDRPSPMTREFMEIVLELAGEEMQRSNAADT